LVFKDSQALQSAYNISIQEQSKVKLLQRFKAFLFQPVELDINDPNFVAAFCGGLR